MAKDYSVFDIVGPNMIGPSSSHTAGAARLGKSASKIAGKPVKEVNFLLHGSFAETYKGHGTDKALVGGILGFNPDDARIKDSFELAKEQGVKTSLLNDFAIEKKYDVVVEATGSISGFETALALTKPRGVLVLKSTVAASKEFNLAPIVIDEITVLGSRCGQFPPALRLLESGKVDFSKLISGTYSFDDAIEAFEKNKEKDTLKILLKN